VVGFTPEIGFGRDDGAGEEGLGGTECVLFAGGGSGDDV